MVYKKIGKKSESMKLAISFLMEYWLDFIGITIIAG